MPSIKCVISSARKKSLFRPSIPLEKGGTGDLYFVVILKSETSIDKPPLVAAKPCVAGRGAAIPSRAGGPRPQEFEVAALRYYHLPRFWSLNLRMSYVEKHTYVCTPRVQEFDVAALEIHSTARSSIPFHLTYPAEDIEWMSVKNPMWGCGPVEDLAKKQ